MRSTHRHNVLSPHHSQNHHHSSSLLFVGVSQVVGRFPGLAGANPRRRGGRCCRTGRRRGPEKRPRHRAKGHSAGTSPARQKQAGLHPWARRSAPRHPTPHRANPCHTCNFPAVPAITSSVHSDTAPHRSFERRETQVSTILLDTTNPQQSCGHETKHLTFRLPRVNAEGYQSASRVPCWDSQERSVPHPFRVFLRKGGKARTSAVALFHYGCRVMATTVNTGVRFLPFISSGP